jgi:hypothetical protein
VLEVHEEAVTNVDAVRQLHGQLAGIRVGKTTGWRVRRSGDCKVVSLGGGPFSDDAAPRLSYGQREYAVVKIFASLLITISCGVHLIAGSSWPGLVPRPRRVPDTARMK